MALLDLTRVAVGDRVQHELLVRERDDKLTKTGDPFIVLKLGNSTGMLSANVWKEDVPLVQGVRPGQIVQVIGTIELYQGRRQLKLSSAPRVVPSAAATMATGILMAKVLGKKGIGTVIGNLFLQPVGRTIIALRGRRAGP